MTGAPVDVSFVIPAYNEEALLGRAIRRIRDAVGTTGLRYEIIVVDDASTDATAAIAAELGATVVPVSHRQIAATRNAGARAAAGRWLIFVDADSVVCAEAVAGAIEALRRGAAAGGAAVRFDGRVPWHARLVLAAMMVMYRVLGLASGSFLFCTRDAFEHAGGFDESMYASEELWMSLALHRCGRFVRVPGTVLTSGRKLRTHTAREIYGVLLRLGLQGTRGVRRRDGLDLWYGRRRPDPEAPPDEGSP